MYTSIGGAKSVRGMGPSGDGFRKRVKGSLATSSLIPTDIVVEREKGLRRSRSLSQFLLILLY